MFMPFPEYRPDVNDYRGQHTQVMSGVLPRGDGWGPFPDLQSYSENIVNGNDSNTKVLLHFDGADASTTITDSNVGGSAHTWTAAGNAQIDTAIYKLGGAALLLDGTGDWVTTADHADFTLGSGAFTVDFWFNCTATTGSIEEIAGQQDSSATNTTRSFRVRRNASDQIEATVTVSTTDVTVTSTTTFTDATNTGWHHVALVRSGDTLSLYIDGVSEDSDTLSGTVNDSANALRVGAAGEVTANPWTGSLDEFRLSSVARWTADFTPYKAAYDEVANGVCRGGVYARASDGSIVVFAATATRLFKLDNSTLIWEDVSKSGTAYSSVPSTDQWQFVVFGFDVVAVQANVAPQRFTVGSSTAFADLAGSPPQARYAAIVGQFIVLSGLTSAARRIHWSALASITGWTAGTDFSNTYDLPDGGVSRGIAGGEFGIIMQESTIRRMVFVPGADPAFQIERISEEKGLLGPYSIVRAGERVLFFSPQGFQEYVPGIGLRPIGKEKVDRTILADLDTGNLHLFIGASDPAGTRAFWAYKSLAGGSSTAFDKMICYDAILERFSPPISMSGEYLLPMVKPGLTLENLDDISPSIDDLPFTLDSIQAALSARLAAFTTDHELGFFDGANLEAILETPEQGLDDGRRMFVRGFYVRTDADDVYGRVKHRANANALLSQTSEAALNSRGFVPHRVDTRLARARVRIAAGDLWTYAMGIEPEFVPSGKL